MMDPSKVSVIIPAYNMANYLGEAVQGILDQTYQNLEVIIVNDASTDHTDQVMQQFDDPRIKYIIHPENRYAAAARNTGIRTSEGGFIAFVDADDKVHPEKLATQVSFLERNSEIGLAYCSRIEIDRNGNPLTLTSAPSTVSLKDLVLGYPFAPSEVVMRREWIFRVGLFDESFRFHGEDPDFHMRLALHGCKMAGVRRVLNYRRLFAGRVFKNLEKVMEGEFRAFQNTFASPLCPADVIALRACSFGMLYRISSFIAFSQNETTLGQEWIRKAMEFDQPFFADGMTGYIEFLVRSSVRSGGDHERVIREILGQLPPELDVTEQDINLALGYGYLLRWARDFLWGRVDSGLQNFEKARSYDLKPDNHFLRLLTTHLLNYEEEFGPDAAREIFDLFVLHLIKAGNANSARKLKSHYMINRAFREYRSGDLANVMPNALEAIGSSPGYLVNRGVLALLFHSTVEEIKNLRLRNKTSGE
jgi:glycosyltransferase involved in cell wall biosynthesis